MSISLNITSNSKELEGKLKKLVTKQFLFAAAVATTKTAVVVRNYYVAPEYKRTFKTRNIGFIKAVHRVHGANASFTKQTGVAVASIHPVDDAPVKGTSASQRGEGTKKTRAGTQFMKRHVSGGVKTPKKKMVAIPNKSIGFSRRKAGATAGTINNAFKPKQLLAKPDYFIKDKGSYAVIVKRVGRGKKKLKLMYALKPSVNIRRRYNPQHVAQRGVDFHFPRLFKREFVIAIKKARLRL
jgi:hypothetical protein